MVNNDTFGNSTSWALLYFISQKIIRSNLILCFKLINHRVIVSYCNIICLTTKENFNFISNHSDIKNHFYSSKLFLHNPQ